MADKKQQVIIWLGLAACLLIASVQVSGSRGRYEDCEKDEQQQQQQQDDDELEQPKDNKMFQDGLALTTTTTKLVRFLNLNIDAMNSSLCGYANFRQWQLNENAFGCAKREPHGVRVTPVAVPVQPRIVNGWPAIEGEFPFFAKLDIIELDDKKYILRCGGMLVHRDLVITAAHCVKNAKEITLTFGSIVAKNGGIERLATKWCMPSRYKIIMGLDVAIIRLDKPLDYVPYKISPACLRLDKPHVDESTCAHAGFGYIGDIDWNNNTVINEKVPEVLQTLELKRVKDSTDEYMNDYVANHYNRTSYKGDSGGPLVCYDSCMGLHELNNDNNNNRVRAFVVGSLHGGYLSRQFKTKTPSENGFVDFYKIREDLARLVYETRREGKAELSDKSVECVVV